MVNGTHQQFLAIQRHVHPTSDTTRVLAERQLDSLETCGMDDVGVAVEWSTAGDDRECKLCKPLQGIVLTGVEARDLIPRHDECRCCWIPANVGESKKGQKRTKTAIDKAIARSLKAELVESGERSSWPGAHRTISEKRPKSILD